MHWCLCILNGKLKFLIMKLQMLRCRVTGVYLASLIVHEFPSIRRSPKHHEIKDEQEEARSNTISDDDNNNNIEDYEEDLTDQRIEGIEALIEQLSKTVLELKNKVLKVTYIYFVIHFTSIYGKQHCCCFHSLSLSL